ncbi:GAF domain-containing protein [Modestobacter marinus]|uniref:GAF domain-containing protein n=1 Tax=Modestobacter marinus TaxID=477641 RepID=UPI0021BC10BB|nr:GAF domain-containing protein [Modestobacter marinus]
MADDVTLAARFTAAVAAAAAEDGDGDAMHLLPERLSRAAVRVLPADGAGISLRTRRDGRIPLGASSEVAALAERLQFTTDEGPCMQAHAEGQPVFVMEDDLRRRWPAFAGRLLTETPYRGAVALPLQSALAGRCALDLYFTDPTAVPRLDVFDAIAVGELMTSALSDAVIWTTWNESQGPDWLHSPAAVRRSAVWQAVGEVSMALDVHTQVALQALRAEAGATGRSVDDVALDVLTGRLTSADLPHP